MCVRPVSVISTLSASKCVTMVTSLTWNSEVASSLEISLFGPVIIFVARRAFLTSTVSPFARQRFQDVRFHVNSDTE